ncbi:hypothetical protein ACIBXA_18220 [Micromonospora echinaurantiaca]|uniref:hypothetical protein n=1 Tax=Micromonospora TaxID=1873 RepID=UPI000D6FFA0F|nr:hypothetical protein [Micromonospora sp. S4605]PWU48016.1 hypothetical protein DLJ47_29095 [Micromonospora sp. S4605]
MAELLLSIQPRPSTPAERVDEFARQLADDLRTVPGLRIAHAQSAADGHGKSQQAWELGMLAVGGLFSAASLRALAYVAVAYADRVKARSITLRSGDNELVITGSTRVDARLVTELTQLIGGTPAATTELPAQPERRPVAGQHGGGTAGN